MSFETLLLLLFLYGVLNFVLRSRKPGAGEEDGADAEAPAPPPPQVPRSERRPGPLRSQPASGSHRLEEFLREFERKLEEASGQSRGPLGRKAAERLPGAEEVEDRTSLEREPEPYSLETEPVVRERELVDFDEVSAAAAARRRRLTEQEARPLTAAGHAAFDQRIRVESLVGESDRAQAQRLIRLREAIVLREVLGPPKSLQ